MLVEPLLDLWVFEDSYSQGCDDGDGDDDAWMWGVSFGAIMRVCMLRFRVKDIVGGRNTQNSAIFR